jgi:hypothetical protein
VAQKTFTQYLSRPLPRTSAEEDAARTAYSLRRKEALAREAYYRASKESGGDLRDPRVVEKARRYQDLEVRALAARWAAWQFESERAGTVEAARAFDLRPSDTVLDYATTAYPSKRGEKMGLRCPVFNIRVRSSDADVVAYAIRNDNTVMGKARAEKYDRYLSVVWSSLLEGGKELYQSSRKTDFRGCGVGPRLYEALAAHACKNDLTMTSDRRLSSDSRAFWKRQQEKGRAKYDEDAKRFVVLDACGIRSTGMRGLRKKRKK